MAVMGCDTVLTADEPSLNGRSRLTIRNAMKNDDGTYMCVAENPAGVRRAIAAVRVKGKSVISLALTRKIHRRHKTVVLFAK
jgi:hypothetical protein